MTAYTDLLMEAALHRKTFMLWPRQWTGYKHASPFDWHVVPFTQTSATGIPTDRGIYAFLIQPKIASDVQASYLVYLGQTDSLRRRFRQYLQEAKSDLGRPKLVSLLTLYRGFLYFSYSTIPEPQDLTPVEDALLEALIPPENDQFPASVRRVINAF